MLNAAFYKDTAKFSYVMLLVLGIAVTSLSGSSFRNFEMSWASYTVVALSLLTSLLVSMLSYSNPSLRWRHLRSYACRFEDIPVFYSERACLPWHNNARIQSTREDSRKVSDHVSLVCMAHMYA